MPYTPKGIRIPPDTSRIDVHVRLIDGIPVLFTERGEMINGQKEIKLHAGVDEVTEVTVAINVEKRPDQ